MNITSTIHAGEFISNNYDDTKGDESNQIPSDSIPNPDYTKINELIQRQIKNPSHK